MEPGGLTWADLSEYTWAELEGMDLTWNGLENLKKGEKDNESNGNGTED